MNFNIATHQTIITSLIIITSFLTGCIGGTDSDNDGFNDGSDNCIDTYNPLQEDYDYDGKGDLCDLDDDGDKVNDDDDLYPFNSQESTDSDKDGVGDNEDAFPNNPLEVSDNDGDGVGDNVDQFPNDVYEWEDSDNDGLGNNADDDDDGDGFNDSVDQFDLTPMSLLNQTGPFNVGTKDVTFTSPRGHELTVQIWYPTMDLEGEKVVYDKTFGGSAFDDATPDCTETRPVTVYSHGFPSIRWGSSFLMSNLASHGFISIAPDHPHMSIWDADIDYLHEAILAMPLDVKDSYNWLSGKSQETSPFEDCINPAEGYAVIGQSTGGYNSMMLAGAEILLTDLEERCTNGDEIICKIKDEWLLNYGGEYINFQDERIWGVVLLSPWNGSILDDGISQVDKPVFILSGNMDETTTIIEVNKTANSLGNSLINYAILNNSGHYAFAPIGCAAYGCDGLLDIDISTSFANESVTIFLAQLLNWPSSENYSMPEYNFVNWEI
jgi:predicted dienelactone hydrolase